MSFDDEARKPGRQPIWRVAVRLDKCIHTYGQAPCTANATVKCYNTRATCQDPPNYLATVEPQRFVPIGQFPDSQSVQWVQAAIPAMIGEPQFAPTEVEPGGLGRRSSVTIRLYDFFAGDRIQDDPYVLERAEPAEGTFLARWLFRNQYYFDRELYVQEGYPDIPLDQWVQRTYLITEMSGPTADGVVTIRAKDPLKILDGDRVQYPLPTNTELAANMNPNTTVMQLTDAAGLNNADYVLVGDEVILLGGFSAPSTFNSCVRGQRGTTNTNHSAGDDVQRIQIWEDTPVEEVIQEILFAAGINPAWVTFSDWQTELATFLPGQNVTGEIWRPTSVRKLLNDELLPDNNLSMWWDARASQIRLKVASPFQDVKAVFNEEDHIVDGNVTVKDEPRRQVITAAMYYEPLPGEAGKRGNKDTSQALYTFLAGELLADDVYGRNAIREFASRWFRETNPSPVENSMRAWVERFGALPKSMEFDIDAKDYETVRTGDVIDVLTDRFVSADGRRTPFRGQITKLTPRIPGHLYRLTLLKYFSPAAAVIPDEIEITTDQANYNLATELGNPPFPFVITVYVRPGVTVFSNDPAIPAFDTGPLSPDAVVNLVRDTTAVIVGAGGAGGSAIIGESRQGRAGGIGVNYQCDGNINTEQLGGGYIGGGGGGGGAGTTVETGTYKGGGGGGGAGRIAGPGGPGVAPGTDGQDGAQETGGLGGNPDSGDPNVFVGNGNELGEAGFQGRSLEDVTLGIYITNFGGPAGFAVKANGNFVTVTTGGNPDVLRGLIDFT